MTTLMRPCRAGFFTGVATVTALRIGGIGGSAADAGRTHPATNTEAMSDAPKRWLFVMASDFSE